MQLIRLTVALALLKAATRILAEESTTPKPQTPTVSKAIKGDLRTTHVEWILLSSIAGMFICGLWIMMTWRAWQ